MDKKGDIFDFIIALVVVIIIIPIAAYIFFYGINSISTQIESIQAYVTQTELALDLGSSVVVGSLAPSFNSNQFMVQFYGTPQCISLLDDLSRDAVLTAPNNPASLEGQYFICSGAYKNFTFQPPPRYLLSKQQSLWIATPMSQSTIELEQDALPNWVILSTTSMDYNMWEINGSQGTMYYENYSTSQDLQAVEEQLGEDCVKFLNASVVPYGPGNPAAYITGMTCVPLGTKNGYPIFISLNTQSCSSVANGCNYDPIVFFHGSPAKILTQFCSYNKGPSIVCSITIK